MHSCDARALKLYSISSDNLGHGLIMPDGSTDGVLTGTQTGGVLRYSLGVWAVLCVHAEEAPSAGEAERAC